MGQRDYFQKNPLLVHRNPLVGPKYSLVITSPTSQNIYAVSHLSMKVLDPKSTQDQPKIAGGPARSKTAVHTAKMLPYEVEKRWPGETTGGRRTGPVVSDGHPGSEFDN